MAVPSYTTDLTDVVTADNNTNWYEMTGHTGGGADAADTDYFVQGTGCVTQSLGSKTGTQVGLEYRSGADVTAFSDGTDVFFFWHVMLAGNAMDTFANGGMRVYVGSSAGNVNGWIVGGSDFGRNPYGGWHNVAVDPTYNSSTPDYTEGTPTASDYQVYCSLPNMVAAVAKGNLHGVDAIRWGRGELIIEFGQAADYGTFVGLSVENDYNDVTNGYHRWGLFQAEGTGYLWKGLLSFGNATNACDFRDSNSNITIDNTPRTYASFNKIEINNASSNVEWTSVSFIALSSTQLSLGSFEAIDNATIVKTSCTFTDMNTFIYQTNTTADLCIWRGCGQITAAGATITNAKISDYSGASDTSVLVWNVATDPNGKLDGSTFTKGTGTTHAIEFGITSPLTMTLTDVDFSGYNAANGQTDSAIHIKRTSGTVTINISGGSSPTYKTDGATVVIVAGAVDVTLTAQTASATKIQNANVFIKASDGTGPFPFEESVAIVNSVTTATVTHTNHGLSTNDKVYIQGASLDANLGVFLITVTDANIYTYTMGSTPGSSPTGAISTFTILNGTTDIDGEITMSRVFASDQNFSGWARKSTSSPFYKTGIVSGTVSSTTGATPIALMILDE